MGQPQRYSELGEENGSVTLGTVKQKRLHPPLFAEQPPETEREREEGERRGREQVREEAEEE